MIRILILSLSFAIVQPCLASSQFQEAYVQTAFADYSAATAGAVKVQAAITSFLQNPTDDSMNTVKSTWTEARKIYSQTEIYRFYGGPIDDEDGPEGLLNAWPLDEVYIDFVKGAPNAGIINDLVTYPEITKDLLVSLNEKDGEKNIATGWHAIEFLLWGQDFNNAGPGTRPVSDFVIGVGKNSDRRRAYLQFASELLVDHLGSVTQQWNVQDADSYANTFLALPEQEAVSAAFTSLTSMSGDELAIERMFVALDGQAQEDEHSCFSDTTNNDVFYNYLGVKNQWILVRDNVEWRVGGENQIEAVDKRIAALDALFAEYLASNMSFDVAIFNPLARVQLQTIVDELQFLSADFVEAQPAIGYR